MKTKPLFTPKTKLPADPEELNHQRAGWAAEAILAFRNVTGTDTCDAVSDLIADLAHWCDRNGISFAAELERGRMHYEEETNDEGKQFKP